MTISNGGQCETHPFPSPGGCDTTGLRMTSWSSTINCECMSVHVYIRGIGVACVCVSWTQSVH